MIIVVAGVHVNIMLLSIVLKNKNLPRWSRHVHRHVLSLSSFSLWWHGWLSRDSGGGMWWSSLLNLKKKIQTKQMKHKFIRSSTLVCGKCFITISHMMMTGTRYLFFVFFYWTNYYLQLHFVLRKDNDDATGTTSTNTRNDGCHDDDDWCLAPLAMHQVRFFFSVFFTVPTVIYSYNTCWGTITTMPQPLPTPGDRSENCIGTDIAFLAFYFCILNYLHPFSDFTTDIT